MLIAPPSKELLLPERCCSCNAERAYNIEEVTRHFDVSAQASREASRPMDATLTQTFKVRICNDCYGLIDAATKRVARFAAVAVVLTLLCWPIALKYGDDTPSQVSSSSVVQGLVLAAIGAAVLGIPVTIALGVVALSMRQHRLRQIVQTDVEGNLRFANPEYQRAFEALNSRE